ncbi:MAG: mitofilin family membrane protein, partial [Pseudomonadota bacterium]
IDAEIIEETSHPAQPDNNEAAASEEISATAAETDTGPDGDADAAPDEQEEKEEGGGLAGPFAIVLGALAIIGGVVFFVNRGGDGEGDVTSPQMAISRAEETPSSASLVTPIPAPDAKSEAEAEPDPQSGSDDAEDIDAAIETAIETDRTASSGEEGISSAPKMQILSAPEDTETNAGASEEMLTDDAPLAAAEGEDETSPAPEQIEETAASIDDGDQTTEGKSALLTRAEARAEEANSSDNLLTDEEQVQNIIEEEIPVAEETPPPTDGTETAAIAPEETAPLRDEPTSDESVDDLTTDQEGIAPPQAAAEDPTDTEEQEVASIMESDASTDLEGTEPAPAFNEEEINARFNSLKDDVRADVIAETEQVIQNALEDTEQALEATEREVAQLRSALDEQQAAANEKITQLSQRVETLTSDDLPQARQSTFLLALADLNEGLESGTPFMRELNLVRNMAPNTPALDGLTRHAEEGLPTQEALYRQYQETARNALSGVKRAEANSPFAKFMANITGLFTVRKVGEVAGDTPSAIISRAEVRLEDNDLKGAVDELNALEGAAQEAFAPWVQNAQAKADSRQALKMVEKAVLTPSP